MRKAATILGTGSALPPLAVTSQELSRRLGVEVPVKVRFHSERETAAQLGARAAQAALEAAGTGLAEVDVLVAASATPQHILPFNAAHLHAALGLSPRVPAFDINSSCLAFLTAFDLMASRLALGEARRVLIVSAEVASVALDWSEPESACLFGDGAGAVVLGFEPAGAVLGARLETYSQGADLCIVRAGTGCHPARHHPRPQDFLFHMDGPALYRLAVPRLLPLVEELLEECGLAWSDLALVIPHQASPAALALVRRRLKLKKERFFDMVDEVGNMVSASLPVALHEALQRGALHRGDKALLLGTAAGVSLGALIFEY